MKIRAAVEQDSEEIAVLCRELGYDASEAEVADRIRMLAVARGEFIAVADDDGGGVLGWIQAHASTALESGFRAEILGLVVSEQARRSGIGRKLVQAAEDWARAISAPTIVVRSNVVRTDSHAFYPALGYVESKTQRVYRKALAPRT